MENETDGEPVTVSGLSDTVVVFVAVCVVDRVGVCVGVSVGGLGVKVDEHEPVSIHVPVGVSLWDSVRVLDHVFVGMQLGLSVGGLRVCEEVRVIPSETVSVSAQGSVWVLEQVIVREGVGVLDRAVGVHVWVPFRVWVVDSVGGDGEPGVGAEGVG